MGWQGPFLLLSHWVSSLSGEWASWASAENLSGRDWAVLSWGQKDNGLWRLSFAAYQLYEFGRLRASMPHQQNVDKCVRVEKNVRLAHSTST